MVFFLAPLMPCPEGHYAVSWPCQALLCPRRKKEERTIEKENPAKEPVGRKKRKTLIATLDGAIMSEISRTIWYNGTGLENRSDGR